MIEQLANVLANLKPGDLVELDSDYECNITFKEYLSYRLTESETNSSGDTTEDNGTVTTEEE